MVERNNRKIRIGNAHPHNWLTDPPKKAVAKPKDSKTAKAPAGSK